MNFSDDFEENLNILIKWLMVVSLIAIVVWCFISLVHTLSSKTSEKKAKLNTEMIKEEPSVADDEAVRELLGLDGASNETGDDLALILDEKQAKSEKLGAHTFKINVSEMPEKLYYNTLKKKEILDKKRKIINQKVGENYIDSVLSYGSLERWNPNSFPLKVYISKSADVPMAHVEELRNAFDKWQETTGGFINFTFVDSADAANIVCSYPQDFYRSCGSEESSETAKQYFTYDNAGHIKKSHIELTYKDCNGEVYANDLVYAVSLRQIGHALGLRGHSGKSQQKVLYYPNGDKNKSVRPEINVADVNTLKLIYSVLPDKTNQDFTEEQRKKLIKPEEVWGDKVERAVSSEKAILYNIERSPDIPSLHIALANYYSEHGKYEEALEVYSRSIVLLNEAELKARVYARVGDTYGSQHRYPEAIEAYKLSLKNLNKKQNLFNVYFNLGYIYFQQGKYNDSLKSYQTAIQFVETKDSFFRLLMDLGSVYVKVGNNEDALKCAQKALSLFDTRDSRYLVAYTNFLNENYEQAETMVLSLIEEYGGAMEYALLAHVYYKTEQYDKLRALAQEAKSNFSNNPPFIFE